jgi:hypothetical protein
MLGEQANKTDLQYLARLTNSFVLNVGYRFDARNSISVLIALGTVHERSIPVELYGHKN